MNMRNKITWLAGMMAFLLAFAGIKMSVHALGGDLLISGNPFSPVTYTYEGEEGVVEKNKEFVISAQAGANYEIEITFTGTGAENEVLSFYYDKATEDQTVPNVIEGQTDRSGLLDEPVKAGEVQVRTFTVAALDGDITIKGHGSGKVLSIKSTMQQPKGAGEKVTVYTIGDSLVQTYSSRYEPQKGWGQTLPEYFPDNVNFVNKGIGGRSTGNYLRQGRLNEVLCSIAPGDYVLIEFGHNDANSGNGDRYVTVANYKKNLADIYIKAIKDRGATPILVTVCNKNDYKRDDSTFIASYPDYVEAMRQVAEETDTLLVDLNAITVEKFNELNAIWGPGVTGGIIYNSALPGIYEGDYANGANDGTHLQTYGAMLVAGYIAEELKEMNLPGLSEYYVPAESATSAPAMPTNLAERVHEKTPWRISWSAVEGADFYQVFIAELVENLKSDGSGSGTYSIDGEFKVLGYTTYPEYAYRMGKKDAHYAYKVVAVNEAGTSPESEVFTFGLALAEPVVTEDAVEPTGSPSAEPTEVPSRDTTTVNPVSVMWKVLGLFVLSVFGFVGLMVLVSRLSNRKKDDDEN